MLSGGATGFLASMSDAELDSRLQSLAADLAIADSKIESQAAARTRARKVARGVVLTVAGILFAAQSGGLTLLLCAIGAVDMLDALEADAAQVKLQAQLRSDLQRYDELYRRIAAEKARRDWW